MMKDVLISINSIHSYDQADEDSLEFTTDGYYHYDGENGCLSYMESEVTGLEGTRTSLFVMPDQVVVDRKGTVTSRMVFKEGTVSSFLYQTPYGESTLGLRTRRIARDLGRDGGRVEIEYEVDMAPSAATRNQFHISVRELPGQ